MKRFLLSIGISLCFLGTSFGQTTIYNEDFTGDDGYGAVGPSNTVDVSGVDWTIDVTNASLTASSDFFQVVSGVFQGQDIDGTQQSNGSGDGAIWESPSINISGYTDVTISLDVSNNNGGFESADFIKAYYIIDSGSEVVFGHLWDDGGASTDLADSTFSVSGLSGSSLEIFVEMDNNAGGELISFDNVLVTGVPSGATPTQLSISTINDGNSPSTNTGFDVVVSLLDGGDNTVNASADTSVTLSLNTGTGSLGGTLTGTITSGNSSVTISGVTYNTAESGVSLTATNTGGSLSSDNSSSFTVLSAADQLVLVNLPSEGNTDTELASFTVEARRSGDSSVDLNYTKSITLSKESGTGSIGGTTSQSASSGVATFDDITFDVAGDYTISAGDGSLTSATSGTITISTVNSNPTIGDLYISEYSDASGSGNFIYEFLELYNPTDEAIDVNGFTFRQRNSTQSFTLSTSTVIPANGFLVIGRDSDESAFETFWNTTFSDNVTYVNSSNSFISINGGEDYLVEDGSNVNVDPASDDTYTAQTVSSSGRVYRIFFGGNSASDYFTGSDSESTPGELDFGVTIDGSAGWRLLSFPFIDPIVTDISDDTPIQGVDGLDDSGFDANFIIYDSNASFTQPTNATTAIAEGLGFGLYFFDNTENGSSELPVNLDALGEENDADVAITLNPASSGYTLVGNPFATNFNANNLVSSIAAIQNTIHFWDGSSYQSEDRTASSGYIVAPWQGFWVQKDASGDAATLTFPTSGKTTSDTTGTYFKSVEARGDIEFTLSSETTIDEALRIAFRNDATFDYDLDDAGKLTPLIPAYATMAIESNEMLKSVESLPYNLEEEVTLSLQPQLVGVSGEFTFGWNGLETIPGEWELILHDYDSGESIDMRSQSEYVFSAGAQAKANPNPLSLLTGPAAVAMKSKAENNRFGITIRPTAVSNEAEESPVAFALEQNYPNPFNPSTTISYSVQEAGAVNISVYNLMGQKVATLVNETKAAGQYNVRWNAAGAASGMYYYRLEAGGQSITRKMTLIK